MALMRLEVEWEMVKSELVIELERRASTWPRQNAARLNELAERHFKLERAFFNHAERHGKSARWVWP